MRDNKAGPHRELFYHVGGCRTWLVVTRDTRTHAIAQVRGGMRSTGRRAMNAPANIMHAAALSQPRRLAKGGLIDRSRPVSFRFDGQSYGGFEGDTLASALIANGVKLVGRSFKYHRPRGILSAGPEEPNALVEMRQGARREPNTRATQVELYDGLIAASQNRWPSLAFDLRAVNALASPLLDAGFYYKTFMWPASFWEKVYEPLIRRAAGLGRASAIEDPDTYEKSQPALRCAGDRLRSGGTDGCARGRPRRCARRPGGAGFPSRRPAAG